MSESFAESVSICCVEDCNRLPVRMLFELEDGEINIVMLCRQHATLYRPTGKVMSDSLLPTSKLEPEVLDAQVTP